MATNPDARGAGPPPSQEDVEASQKAPTEEEEQRRAARPGGSSAVAAALGGGMLGLDQALRREPPAQIVAAEHQPERGGAGDDADLVIEIPMPSPSDPGAGEPPDR